MIEEAITYQRNCADVVHRHCRCISMPMYRSSSSFKSSNNCFRAESKHDKLILKKTCHGFREFAYQTLGYRHVVLISCEKVKSL